MGKICDPPPFTGGQCVGEQYYVELKCYYTDGSIRYAVDENVSQTVNTRWSYLDAVAPININVIVEYQYSWYGVSNSLIYFNGVYRTYIFPKSIFPNIPCYRAEIYRVQRKDGQLDDCGDPPSTNCRCSDDSCRVDCATAPDGFCCIDNSFTDRLLQIIKN